MPSPYASDMLSSSTPPHGGHDRTVNAEVVEGDAILALMLARATPREDRGTVDTVAAEAAFSRAPLNIIDKHRILHVNRQIDGRDTALLAMNARISVAQSSPDRVCVTPQHRMSGSPTQDSDRISPTERVKASSSTIEMSEVASQLDAMRHQIVTLQAENGKLTSENRTLGRRNRVLQAYVIEYEKHCGFLV